MVWAVYFNSREMIHAIKASIAHITIEILSKREYESMALNIPAFP